MYTLRDNGIVDEMKCGNNFSYILQDNKYFMGTDYKVLQSQTNGIFIPCMKMLFNGKIQLYYLTDEYSPMSTMLKGIKSDMLINIIVNLFGSVVEVKNNGFLSSQNIDVSWDKIFVDATTLQVKLVYLPVNVKVFDSFAEFQSELRSGFIKLINNVIQETNDRISKFNADLANGSMTIEEIFNKYKGAGMAPIIQREKQEGRKQEEKKLKLVAMNAPQYFEVVLDGKKNVLGKKKDLVDIVIDFNNMISRKHCCIEVEDGIYYVKDEGSSNGTYVNGVKLVPFRRKEIGRGDIIRLANSDFQLV